VGVRQSPRSRVIRAPGLCSTRQSPLDSQVRVVWQGPVRPGEANQAQALLRARPGVATEALLLNGCGWDSRASPAIAQLGRWVSGPGLAGWALPPPRCPMLLVGGGPAPKVPSALTTFGVT